MTTRPAVDIVVVTFNTREEVLVCLASVFAHPPTPLGTVFLVDNASTDGTVAAVDRAWPSVRVVALDRNLGFGAANNVALRLASSPLVLLLNSDTRLPAGAIDRLTERLVDANAVAAGPRLVDLGGRPEISFGAMLSPFREAVQSVRIRLAARRGALPRRYIRHLLGRERLVDWVSGACLLVWRQAAIEAGLFDERYFLYEEDVDFCAALRARGGRILFTPHASVVHRRGGSHGPDAAVSPHYDRSHLAFYEKHAPRWVPWLRLWQRVRRRSVR